MPSLGMVHRTRDDFNYPALSSRHPLGRHVLYRNCQTLDRTKTTFFVSRNIADHTLKTAHLQNMHAVQVIRLGLHEGKAAQDIASKASLKASSVMKFPTSSRAKGTSVFAPLLPQSFPARLCSCCADRDSLQKFLHILSKLI